MLSLKSFVASAFLVIISYAALAVAAFQKFSYTFFQQDEWLILGTHIYWDKAGLSWWDRIFYHQFSHIVPFTILVTYLHSIFFGVNFFPYALVSIGMHVINGILVYFLSLKLLKDKYISFFAGLLFIVNPNSHQAVTWVATNVGTAGSTIFVLLSLISFLQYLKNFSTKFLLISCAFLFSSLFFKETSVFCFIFFPILGFLYIQPKSYFLLKKIFLYFTISGFIYVSIRVLLLIHSYKTYEVASQLTQPSISVFIYRIITSPLKFLSQSIVPVEIVVENARKLILLGYPQYPLFVREGEVNPFITETIATDIVSYVYAIIFLVLAFLTARYYFKKNTSFYKGIVTSVIFIFLSSLPYILIPGKAGYFSLIDGRHLYLTSVFVVILVSILVWSLVDVIGYGKKIVFLVIMCAFVIYGTQSIQKDIDRIYKVSLMRQNILEQIHTTYPKLPSRVMIYAESDSAYYAAEEKILPFQSGFGHTLLIWYSGHGENFPSCFFDSNFLYEWLSEGYKECGGRGFGYFRKIDTIKEAVSKYNFPVFSIYGFRFNSSEEKLEDITKALRTNLENR